MDPFFAKWKSKNAKSKNLLMALQCTHWQHDQCSIHLEERKNCNVKKEWFRDWKYVFNNTFFSEYPLKLWQTLFSWKIKLLISNTKCCSAFTACIFHDVALNKLWMRGGRHFSLHKVSHIQQILIDSVNPVFQY